MLLEEIHDALLISNHVFDLVTDEVPFEHGTPEPFTLGVFIFAHLFQLFGVRLPFLFTGAVGTSTVGMDTGLDVLLPFIPVTIVRQTVIDFLSSEVIHVMTVTTKRLGDFVDVLSAVATKEVGGGMLDPLEAPPEDVFVYGYGPAEQVNSWRHWLSLPSSPPPCGSPSTSSKLP